MLFYSKNFDITKMLDKSLVLQKKVKNIIIYFPLFARHSVYLDCSCLQVARGSEVGMAPTTGRESMAEAAANAGITQHTRKCALSRFLSSLCSSHRFKNLQVGYTQTLSIWRARLLLVFFSFIFPAFIISRNIFFSLLLRECRTHNCTDCSRYV